MSPFWSTFGTLETGFYTNGVFYLGFPKKYTVTKNAEAEETDETNQTKKAKTAQKNDRQKETKTKKATKEDRQKGRKEESNLS